VRTNTLKIRLSDAELARLDRLAADWGFKTRAGTVRALLRGAESPEITAAEGPVPGPSLETLLEAQAIEQAARVGELEDEMAEQGAAISSDEVLRHYEELHALVEGELSRAKDTAALNTALRSLLSAATVNSIDYLGVEIHFTLVGDGPGLRASTVGGWPDRIRREDY
jgi:hypothetical protein